jgi:hypothetical protein
MNVTLLLALKIIFSLLVFSLLMIMNVTLLLALQITFSPLMTAAEEYAILL